MDAILLLDISDHATRLLRFVFDQFLSLLVLWNEISS